MAGSSQEDAWFPGLGLLWGDARTLFSDPSRRGTDQLLALTAAAGGLQVLTRGRVTQAGLLDGAAVARGQVWRLGTAVLLHGGLVHFAWNAVALNVLGPQLERWVGTRRFLELYAASGVAGSALHCAMSRRPGVGASGALFGLLGALIVCFESRLPRPGGPAAAPRRPHDWRAALGAPDGGPGPGVAARRAAGELDPYLLYLNAVGGIGLSIVLFPILGFWAHVGGLAGGGLCMFALLEPRGRDAVSAAAMRGRASVAARELWRRCRNAIEQITGL